MSFKETDVEPICIPTWHHEVEKNRLIIQEFWSHLRYTYCQIQIQTNKSNSNQIQIKFKSNSNSNQIIILKFLITDPEPQRMSTYHSDGSSVWRSHAISRYLCLSFLLTTFVTMLVVVWKTQDLLQNKPQNQPTKSFSTEKKIPNSRSACSAHLALKKKKENQSPDRLCSKSGHQERILCASWIIQY